MVEELSGSGPLARVLHETGFGEFSEFVPILLVLVVQRGHSLDVWGVVLQGEHKNLKEASME